MVISNGNNILHCKILNKAFIWEWGGKCRQNKHQHSTGSLHTSLTRPFMPPKVEIQVFGSWTKMIKCIIKGGVLIVRGVHAIQSCTASFAAQFASWSGCLTVFSWTLAVQFFYFPVEDPSLLGTIPGCPTLRASPQCKLTVAQSCTTVSS